MGTWLVGARGRVFARAVISGALLLNAVAACSSEPREFAKATAGSGGGGMGAVSSGGATTLAGTAGTAEAGSLSEGGAPLGTGGTQSEGGMPTEPGCPDVDTDTDVANCGECEHACAEEQRCAAGVCEDLPLQCQDKALSGDETDLDCGGSCAPCDAEKGCKVDVDCSTKYCHLAVEPAVCRQPKCSDGVQNQGETAKDCGGQACRDLNLLCNNGSACGEDGDCVTGYCKGGTCTSPTCGDEVLNNQETDTDCGGPNCRALKPCDSGGKCQVDDDCSNKYCKNDVCTKPTCTDGAKNQDETGLDCGGPTCRGVQSKKCPDNQGCAASADCSSGFCSSANFCSPAGCANGAKDNNETDKDCGGDDCRSSSPCALTKACVIHADCASAACVGNKCVAASCSDSIQNQGETAVDCGGPTCSPAGKTCATPKACAANRDCSSGFCLNDKCSDQCLANPVVLGCPCSSGVACNGPAQKLRLICTGGEWKANSACLASENCVSADGSCATIVPACAGKTKGYAYCEGVDTLRTCGDDLVTAASKTCAGVCSAGACVAAVCGDKKTQAGEECDDGNAVAGDGCEPTTCHKSAVTAFGLGENHSCALLKDGYVRCWGNNEYGQLGQGSTAYLAEKQPYEIPVLDVGGSVTALAAGQEHTCALLTDGSVRCWGRNSEGELGLGNITAHSDKTPHAIGAVKLGEKAIAISAKSYSTCALLASKAVRCWGPNSSGELGLGNTQPLSETKTPDQVGAVALGGLAQAVSVGGGHSCALLANGTVRCWGLGFFGALGLSSTSDIGDNELPSASGNAGLVPFPNGRTAVSISLGQVHSCALMDNGFLQCWGDNSDGALGLLHFDNIGDDESPGAWGQSLVGNALSSVVSGDFDNCALYAADGALRCWGYNAYGQLGQSDVVHKSVPSQLSAVAFGGGLTAKVVAGGTNHTCALLNDGQVRCWGHNGAGQLGFGTVSKGAVLYVGGDAAHTPDKLTSIRVLP